MSVYLSEGQRALPVMAGNIMRKVYCALIFSLLMCVTAMADSVRIGRHEETVAERGSEEYFSRPFSCVFDTGIKNDRSSEAQMKWKFYDDGRAVLYHDYVQQLYECYYYTVSDGVLRLEGVCSLSSGVRLKMLPEKPSSLELAFGSYGPEATLSGKEPGRSGRDFELTLSPSDYISRFESKDFAAIMKCRHDGVTSSCENLWLVTYEFGADARDQNGEGEVIVNFGQWDVFQGHLSEDGTYVLVDYVDGEKLYIEADEVKKVSDESMLQEILYNNANAGLDFTEWQGTFPEKKWKAETAGYFNGWMAGRRAAEVFVWLIFLALLLFILNKFNPPFYPNFLFYATYAAVILIVLFELWYVASLKGDALWFITDPVDFVHGFAAVVGTIVFIFLQVELILSMEASLGEIYSAYTRCPFWVELVLALVALFAGLPLLLSGQLIWALCAYLLLSAACLPTTIGYMRHSADRMAVLPFLLFYPFKYVLMVPLLLLYVFGRAARTRVSVDSGDDDGSRTVRDMEGNTVHLTRMPNGDFVDNDGTVFSKNGDSFTPNGASRHDGPYR